MTLNVNNVTLASSWGQEISTCPKCGAPLHSVCVLTTHDHRQCLNGHTVNLGHLPKLNGHVVVETDETVCARCGDEYERDSTTQRYCQKCRTLIGCHSCKRPLGQGHAPSCHKHRPPRVCRAEGCTNEITVTMRRYCEPCYAKPRCRGCRRPGGGHRKGCKNEARMRRKALVGELKRRRGMPTKASMAPMKKIQERAVATARATRGEWSRKPLPRRKRA